MLKILIVDLGSAWGGQEIYTQNLINGFIERGYNITHVSSQLNHDRDEIIFFKVKNHWSNFYSNSVLINELIQQNDIILFNGNRAIQQAFLIRKDIPFIAIKHGPFSVSNFGFIGNLFLKIIYFLLFKKQDKIICVAKITYNESVKLACKKVIFLPNAVHGPNVANGMSYSQSDSLNLIYCGRLIEDKGIAVILNVILLIQKIKPFSVKLNIFGSGPLEHHVINFIKDNNLDRVIKFNGFSNDRDVIYCINKPSLMLFASKFEGMPLSILEAFSYGIPIVAYNAPGVSDVVIDGVNGILINDTNFSPVSMVEKILYLIDNRALLDNFSSKNLDEFSSKYSFNKMFEKFVSELTI